MRKTALLVPCLAILFSGTAFAGALLPSQAEGAAGQIVTVCGTVTGERSAPEDATLLLLADTGAKKPGFAILIPADSRSQFAASPGKVYRGKRLCVTGKIRTAAKTPPHIAVRGAWQVEDIDRTDATGEPSFGLSK